MEEFKFDMGDPTNVISMTDEEVKEVLKTIPQETLDAYGIGLDNKGDDTPEEAEEEGRAYAIKLLSPTRMVREGYTCTDHADYYWWDHQKWSGRGGKKPGFIIPHHMAGNLTVEQFYAIMKSIRQMSPTISIHTDGTVYAWVPEEMRPWTTGSYTADQDALTMEIANDEIGGDWHISDTAYNMAVVIAAEWCKRYGIDPYWKPGAMGTIQMHKEWAPTACPGPYMSRKIESGQFEAVKAYADKIGAALAGSRPVADQGFIPFDDQIGESGTVIQPKLCIIFGVSGAIQFTEGIKGDGTIIAVNNDPNAPIRGFADVFICADMGELLIAMNAQD